MGHDAMDSSTGSEAPGVPPEPPWKSWSASALDPQLVIPLAALSIPILWIASPLLGAMIPLVYIVTTIGGLTLAARYLLEVHHELSLEKMAHQKELLRLERSRYQEAERLIERDERARLEAP